MQSAKHIPYSTVCCMQI